MRRILFKWQENSRQRPIYLFESVVTAKKFDATAKAEIKAKEDVNEDDMIFDIGPSAALELEGLIKMQVPYCGMAQ